MTIKSMIVWLILHVRPKILLKPLALFYHLAIRSVVSSLKKHPNVAAIYLCGSVAQSAILPALSDIDLKIFLRGEKDSDDLAEILNTFSRLRLLFPMISIPEELGIHFLGDFHREYDGYPLLKHLFDQRFHPRKLVWGQDVLAGMDLTPSGDEDFYPACLWRFKYWFEKLAGIYRTKALNQAQKRYLFYKAVADIGLVYLILNDPRYSYLSRLKTLQDITPVLPRPERALIPRLALERKALFATGSFTLDEAFSVFKKLVSLCCHKIERASKQETAEWPVVFKGNKNTGDQEIIERIREALGIHFKVVGLPSTYMATSPLDYETSSLPVYVLLPEQSLSLEQLEALGSFQRHQLKNRASLFIKENDHYLYSVYSHFMDHILEARFSGQATFHLLSANPGPAAAKMHFNVFYLELLKKKLAYFIEQLEGLAGNKDIYKMDPASYFQLFFSSLSKLILYRSLSRNMFHLVTDPRAIADYLVSNLSISEQFMDRMVAQARPLESSAFSNPELVFQQSLNFLVCFCQVARNKKSQEELIRLSQTEIGAPLPVSVIIVTKSHAAQLRRCLSSLSQLDRFPEEVIVVDNDSRDSTKKTVLGFQGPFPVRYVHFSGFGIGKVRNAGIGEAKGEILVFVDDDAVVAKDWLGNLIKEFYKNPHLGICGGSIRNMALDRHDLVYRYFSMMDLM